MVNRGFCSPDGFKYELDCSCFRSDVQDNCLRYPGGHEGQMFPGRAEPSTSLPARPCAAPPRPARGMFARVLDSASWIRQVCIFVPKRFSSRRNTGLKTLVNRSLCSSIGLHRISLFRASGETFKRCVFDALEGTRDAWANCSVGVQSCPTPPRHRAVRPDPNRSWYVRILDSTNI